ncbi:hypothetical protein ACWF9Z_02040, partial [Streptomyces sp. NPDC054961]
GVGGARLASAPPRPGGPPPTGRGAHPHPPPARGGPTASTSSSPTCRSPCLSHR